jgi:hypothetical protein
MQESTKAEAGYFPHVHWFEARLLDGNLHETKEVKAGSITSCYETEKQISEGIGGKNCKQ